MAITMKEAIVAKGAVVKIVDSEIPKPGQGQLLIRVVVSGSNPKDWKVPEWTNKEHNSGDDIAGVVEAVGENVRLFKKGDRVAAFHEMMTPGGSFAEYAIAWEHTTIHIPDKLSFEDAATVPLVSLTAAVGLFQSANLGLPSPWDPATTSTPLLIYGGASSVGSAAIQLAARANIHPIITVAGNGIPFVETLLDRSKGDTIIDYRQGDEAVVEGIYHELKGAKLKYAFDTISEKGSYVNIGKVLDPKEGRITFVLPIDESLVPGGYKHRTMVGDVHAEWKDFGFVHFQNIARGLAEGWFKAHPYQVVGGGLDGVEEGLTNLKNGKASALKYVFRIGETEGVTG
ncbi:hypothetical protein VE03_01375 [Pseudogymnoascus sp. 23342-1-I1]|nr:hypothetical protein VE03_01375 [Pseudogymnoascus sp. 23342-1-I1]